MLDKQRLFSDPNIAYPINNMELPFAEYITKCQSLIASTRVDLTNNTAEKIINANTPFELKPSSTPSKTGILLIHGLLDCPLHVIDIGKALQSQGYLVRSVLLPGHGTVPGALLNVDYRDWLQTVRYAMTSLKKEVDDIILMGHSTGAALALYQAIEHPTIISGVVLFSPALKIRSCFAPVSHWYRLIDWAWLQAAWFHKDREETIDYAKYLSLPYNAIYQVYLLTQALHQLQQQAQVTCPLLFIFSQDDKIVCPDKIIKYFSEHTNPKSHMLLYTNNTNHFNDSRIEVKPSAYPKDFIINFPHTMTAISPDNAHYGKMGDYKYASRIDETGKIHYGEYLRDDLFYNQCMLKLGLTTIRKERLTFNPDFDYMSQCITNFVETI